jgi:phosphatidate cytidylyltransferase
MLKARLITALILIPIVLAIIFYCPPIPFLLLTSLVAIVGAYEWSRLMGIEKKSYRFGYVFFVGFSLVGTIFLPAMTIFTLAFLFWSLASLFVILYPKLSSWWNTGYLIRGLMGVLVLAPCWGAINYIRSQTDGAYGLLFLFVLIWGADSVAYFVGKKWGKTKLAPLVSPGKSIQGMLGALLYAALMPLILISLLKSSGTIWFWASLLSIVTVLFSIMGDLFESMMKRQVGLKDSGQILPGHGGLLDRIDSLTAAAPVFTLGGILLGIYLH